MPAGYAGEAIVRAFLDGLEQHCSAWCLLGACSELPAAVHSDIDFMVMPEDFDRLEKILAEIAAATGFRLVQALRHETTACYFILAQSRLGQVLYLHPDAATDYRRNGRIWLRARDVLARRRRHANGFWVASAADNFHYYLVKRINKRCLEETQAQELGRWFSEDPEGCARVLVARFGPETAEQIERACRTGEWGPVFATVEALDEDLMSRAARDGLGERVKELGRRFGRWQRPTGLWIAVLGPDGSGKSTVIEKLEAALAPAFRRTARFHLRPHLLRGTRAGERMNTDPHGQRPRGLLASALKLLFFWADYVLGYWLRIRPLLVRSTLVIFDRYSCDLLIDPLRFRSTAPHWLARTIGRLIPVPDLLLILDAPPEVLQARKPEVPAEESARQAQAYRAFASSGAARGRGVLVDAARPVDDVLYACAEEILRRMVERTAKRLRLQPEKA